MHRDGDDLKELARVLNAGAEPPEWLAQAIEPTNGVVDGIDMTVADQPGQTARRHETRSAFGGAARLLRRV